VHTDELPSDGADSRDGSGSVPGGRVLVEDRRMGRLTGETASVDELEGLWEAGRYKKLAFDSGALLMDWTLASDSRAEVLWWRARALDRLGRHKKALSTLDALEKDHGDWRPGAVDKLRQRVETDAESPEK
jgi:hypothetical protein